MTSEVVSFEKAHHRPASYRVKGNVVAVHFLEQTATLLLRAQLGSYHGVQIPPKQEGSTIMADVVSSNVELLKSTFSRAYGVATHDGHVPGSKEFRDAFTSRVYGDIAELKKLFDESSGTSHQSKRRRTR